MAEFKQPTFNESHPLRIDERGTLANVFYYESAKQQLKALIERDGIDQTILATKLGMSRETLNRRVNNPVKFTRDELDVICKEFGVTTDYIRGVTHKTMGTGALAPNELAMFYEHYLTDEQRATISSIVREMVGHNEAQNTIAGIMLGL